MRFLVGIEGTKHGPAALASYRISLLAVRQRRGIHCVDFFVGDGQKNRIRRAVVFLQTFALTTPGDADQSRH